MFCEASSIQSSKKIIQYIPSYHITPKIISCTWVPTYGGFDATLRESPYITWSLGGAAKVQYQYTTITDLLYPVCTVQL